VYSQHDEERFICDYFGGKDEGRFLDIGAADGVCFSNTKALHKRGWCGVAVEPSPNFCESLRAMDRITVVEAALCDTDGPVELYHTYDFVSTMNEGHSRKWAELADYQLITVAGISWSSLLRDCGCDFDFMNLDIEGDNIKVLRRIPSVYLERLLCVCIEYDDDIPAVESLLSPYGFGILHTTGENVVMGKTK